jgi:hypothetical protein
LSRKLRSNYSGIHLKGLSRRSRYSPGFFSSYRISRLLDTEVSVRIVLKYVGIFLAFAIIFFSVFMLGRISADGSAGQPVQKQTQLSGQTKQVIKSEAAEEPAPLVVEEPSSAEVVEDAPDADEPAAPVVEEPVTSVQEVVHDTAPLPLPCQDTVAGFDYNYRNVIVDVTDFQRDLKGDNWATVTSLKLTVTNNETCTIINPTKLKLKLNPKYKGSVWWDADQFLPESFQHMMPGQTVSEIISVHASYSDIYSEKDFKLTVFDDFDIAMGTFKKYITLP